MEISISLLDDTTLIRFVSSFKSQPRSLNSNSSAVYSLVSVSAVSKTYDALAVAPVAEEMQLITREITVLFLAREI